MQDIKDKLFHGQNRKPKYFQACAVLEINTYALTRVWLFLWIRGDTARNEAIFYNCICIVFDMEVY